MVLPFVQLKATRVSTTTCGEICHPEIKPNLPDTNATVKKKKSLFDRFLSYFNDANKNKKQKKSSKADEKIDRDAQSTRNTGIKIQRGKDEKKRNT